MTLDGSQQPVAGRLSADQAGNDDAPGQWQTAADPFRRTVGLVLGDALPAAVVIGKVLLALVAFSVLADVALHFAGRTPGGWTAMLGVMLRVVMGYWVGRILVPHYLPRYVVHGGTRGAFLRQAPLIITTLAAYGVVGFAVAWFAERATYRLFGWSYTASFVWVDFLDEAADGALHALLTQEPWWSIWYLGMHWLLFILWGALGALLAAGFARSRLVGLLCVPVSVILIVVTEPVFAPQRFPFPGPPLLLAVAIASLLAWLLTWMLLARAPIRIGAGELGRDDSRHRRARRRARDEGHAVTLVNRDPGPGGQLRGAGTARRGPWLEGHVRLTRSPRCATARLFAEQAGKVGLVCVGVAAVWVALGGVGPLWVNPHFSLWEPMAGLAVRVGIAYPLGRRLVRTHLPRYVLHGQTRREFLRAAAVVGATYTLLLATFLTVGLVVEAWVHAGQGQLPAPLWSHLFHTPEQVWLVFVECGLIVLLWTTAGAAVAASKFNSPSRSYGFLAAFALVALAENAIGTPLPGGVGFTVSPPVRAAVALCLAVIASGCAATWRLLRAAPAPGGGA